MIEGNRLRILLAEDNEINQRIALSQLESLGYAADVVGDGAAAVRAVTEQRYDLVLMDVQMPGMDGLAATRAICERCPREERPRIVAITANALAGDREKCLQAGMDDYLSKPISRARLAAVLAAVAPPPAKTAAREEVVTVAKAAVAPAHPLLVLVADDNMANQRVAEAQFGALGYAVDLAGDGREALAALERKAYDVVFMDMKMPGMDGLEATRRICARWEAGARPRIVGMTAEAGDEAKRTCLAAGMDDCISKPIARAELAKLLTATPRRKP